jgi:hypothetical protein
MLTRLLPLVRSALLGTAAPASVHVASSAAEPRRQMLLREFDKVAGVSAACFSVLFSVPAGSP